MLADTIAAISTSLGEGGIGIVRISGEDAVKIMQKIFKPCRRQAEEGGLSHHVYYGHIIDPGSGQAVDEVLVTVMLKPHSYTVEDVVEINCHGGIAPLRKVLAMAVDAGARLAEAGEFTKRAFLNGRIDLAQAEAVIDIVRSRTEKGLDIAVNQLGGRLSRCIQRQREELLSILAMIEAGIDFPDEVEEQGSQELEERIAAISNEVQDLLSGANAGRIYREGIRMVIAGKTNVGKSSLLNALLRERRAIVTEVPGTTRDLIEEVINLKGIPARIIDTAGIRRTEDIVEKLGIERTREAVKQADLVFLVLDASAGITGEDTEIKELAVERKTIVVLNKIDLTPAAPGIGLKEAGEWGGGLPVIEISAKEEIGLEQLEEMAAEMVLSGSVTQSDEYLVTRMRHQEGLRRTARHLQQVTEGAALGVASDLLSIDLKAAWEALGEVLGETVGEDVIDRIFAEFCVGK